MANIVVAKTTAENWANKSKSIMDYGYSVSDKLHNTVKFDTWQAWYLVSTIEVSILVSCVWHIHIIHADECYQSWFTVITSLVAFGEQGARIKIAVSKSKLKTRIL